MAVHNMDLLLLRVAVAGSLIVALMFVLPSPLTGGGDGPTPAPAPADISYGMICWCPDHFTDSSIRFTDATCRDKFIRFARNESNSSIHAPTFSDIPSNSTDEIDPELQRLRDVIRERMKPQPEKSQPKSQKVEGLLSSYTSVLIQLGSSVVIYAIASWIRAAASSSTNKSCIKAVQASVQRSDTEESAVAEDKDILQPSGVASARLTSLSRSSTLAILYLLLHLASALMWFILCGVNHHNASLIAAATSSSSSMAELDTTPVSLNGQILCDFHIIKLGNLQPYTVQCSYEVEISKRISQQVSPNKYGSNGMPDLTMDIARSNAALCLTLGVLGLLHIVNFFLFSAKSHWNSMNRILQQAGIKTSSGATFGSTDLYLASAFSD